MKIYSNFHEHAGELRIIILRRRKYTVITMLISSENIYCERNNTKLHCKQTESTTAIVVRNKYPYIYNRYKRLEVKPCRYPEHGKYHL
jgi:hypothetical protein